MRFAWYDLETLGTDPRGSRICQFAGVATDADLHPVGEPLVLYVKPADDVLPSPFATLVTGITPQHALAEGVCEAEALGAIHDFLAVPGTCALGYNSLRFDDEFLRHGFYRNFLDPYEREWRNGNSRWDLLDVARMFHALRPEGLQWPTREDGHASFRLEHLAAANGCAHAKAHDALSDVEALIAFARLLRAAQPRLWDYALKLRDKRHVRGLLDLVSPEPVLHVSGRYPAERRCAALVLPLAEHPSIGNRMIVADLEADPEAWADLDAEAMADHLYTRREDLPEGAVRAPLKELHLHRCPVLVPTAHLRDEDYARMRLDPGRARAHAEALRARPGLAETVRRVYARPGRGPADDVDAALYDGFLPDADKRRLREVRATPPARLGALAATIGFQDPRYAELLLRYRARNWPDTLDEADRARWQEVRRARLQRGAGGALDLARFAAELAEARAARGAEPGATPLLDAAEDWARRLAATLD